MNNDLVSRGTFALGALLAATAAHATGLNLFRTYVSSHGNDANACTVAAPCRLLPAALSNVVDGGEIWMLDSANYNTSTVTITKSVTIVAVPGAVGSVVAIGGGPAIDASTAGTKVVLRNLVVVPFPGGAPLGIAAGGAMTLTLEGCLVAGHAGDGISAIGTTLRILDSVIRDNGNDGVFATGGTTVIYESRITGNGGQGVEALTGSASRATVGRSVLAGNGGVGISLNTSTNSSTGRAVVTRSSVVDNVAGVGVMDNSFTGSSLVLTIGNSAVTGNSGGGLAALVGGTTPGPSAVIETQGNNLERQNGLTGGTITPVGSL